MAMITFHIGFHKTGTTYLQREVFRSYRGCFVASGGGGACGKVLKHLAGTPAAAYRPEIVGALLNRLSSSFGHALLSREELSGRLWDDPVRTGERTASRLAALADRIRVVVCVRRQDQMLNSVYAQYVRQGGIEPPPLFANSPLSRSGFDTRHLEYDRLVERYIRSLGRDRVLVLPYERLLSNRTSFASEIAAFAGGTFEGRCTVRRHNRSLQGARLDALRRWNKHFRRSRFNRSPTFPTPGAAFARYLFQATQRPWRPSSAKQAWLQLVPEAQAERYRRCNRRLEKMCGLNLAALGYPM